MNEQNENITSDEIELTAYLERDVNESANYFDKTLLKKVLLDAVSESGNGLDKTKVVEIFKNDPVLNEKEKLYFIFVLGTIPGFALEFKRNQYLAEIANQN